MVSKSFLIKPGDQLTVYTPYKSKLNWLPNPEIRPNIVFEDDDLMVLNKPSGLMVHPATGHYSNTLINGLVAYLQPKNEKPFLIHRLDKFTEGLMVIAKHARAQKALMNQMATGQVKRAYNALVWGRLKKANTIHSWLGRDLKYPKKFITFDTDGIGRKEAITHYNIQTSFPFHTWIECQLETGRTHQIRVHLASIGHPVFGDFEYGGDQIRYGLKDADYLIQMEKLLALRKGQLLMAHRLQFRDPFSGKPMVFDLPISEQIKTILNGVEKWG